MALERIVYEKEHDRFVRASNRAFVFNPRPLGNPILVRTNRYNQAFSEQEVAMKGAKDQGISLAVNAYTITNMEELDTTGVLDKLTRYTAIQLYKA